MTCPTCGCEASGLGWYQRHRVRNRRGRARVTLKTIGLATKPRRNYPGLPREAQDALYAGGMNRYQRAYSNLPSLRLRWPLTWRGAYCPDPFHSRNREVATEVLRRPTATPTKDEALTRRKTKARHHKQAQSKARR